MQSEAAKAERTVWTVGHSNQSLESFLDLLRGQQIDVIVDVRSSPYCRYATHFNQAAVRQALADRRIRYLFLGDCLGGRVEGDQFYDEQGRVCYDRVAASNRFQEGIERLLGGIGGFRVALMCGEEDPTHCHRRLLVGRVLAERGVEVRHLRGDGRVQSEEEVARDAWFKKTKGQLSLFEREETEEWKSTQSVLPRKTPESSSESSGDTPSGDSSTCG